MKRYRIFKLNTKLLATFFTAVFFLCTVNALLLSYLLNSLEREVNPLNRNYLKSVETKLNNVLTTAQYAHTEMMEEKVVKALNVNRLGDDVLNDLYWAANAIYGLEEEIHGWIILIRGNDCLVTNNGVYPMSGYDALRSSDTYDVAFWQQTVSENFYKRYYAAESFCILTSGVGKEERILLPVVFKSHRFRDTITTVLFLDIEKLCEETDPDLSQGFYLFSSNNEILYSADKVQQINAIPDGTEITLRSGKAYVAKGALAVDGIQCVKLLPEGETTEIVRKSLMICLVAVVGSLLAVSVFVLLSIRRTMYPVNGMLTLLRQNTDLQDESDMQEAKNALGKLLKQREQQQAELALRDAELSEYFLQSRMKNVYVDMNRKEDIEENAYILYIQVRYRKETPDTIQMHRAELENCLQEMMSGVLNKLFLSTMIFQLEPGRFAARVTLARADDRIDAHMKAFMKRLENEQEFACFTVVLSQMLSQEDEMSVVYSQVQEAARTAQVCDQSQLICLPVQQHETDMFSFSHVQEKNLNGCMRSGDVEKAAALALEILRENLEKGITHAQMEILCVALVNTVTYAVTELPTIVDKIAAASGVYNKLTSKCFSEEEYCETVVNFIYSVANNRIQTVDDEPLLRRIQQYLRDNYNKDFSSEQMADALFVSRKYLSAYYKSKTGMNLSESIQMFRIQKAIELLKDPKIRIGDIGPMVGIPSSNTFLRQFRKYTGTTPKEYRLMHIL